MRVYPHVPQSERAATIHKELAEELMELLCMDRPWHDDPAPSASTHEERLAAALSRYSRKTNSLYIRRFLHWRRLH